jgi:hypothetical protein
MHCGDCPHFELTGNHRGNCTLGHRWFTITDEGCVYGWPEVRRTDTCVNDETFEPIGAAAWRVIQKLKTRLENPNA